MARTFVQPGKNLTLTAPVGGVTVGVGYIFGAIFVIALNTVLAGVSFEGATTGIWELTKVSAQAWVQHEKVYWDVAAAKATTVAAGNRYIGVAASAAANPTSTGLVRLNGTEAPMNDIGVPVSLATAGDVTLTAAQVLSGLLVVDCAGAGRTYTLPTAAILVAAIPGVQVGDIVRCKVVNGSDAAEAITLAAGTGGAFETNQTASSRVIGQNTSKELVIRITNVTASSEAYVVYA